MADGLSVLVVRGETVEARHCVHLVAVLDGRIVAASGNGRLVTLMRSAAKPLQALLLARDRPDADERDLAIASASHRADAAQLEAVRALLAKAPATDEELECGTVGEPPARIRHNCSGKHAAMLAVCAARGWRRDGYRLPEHPLQQEVLRELAAAADVPAAGMPTAVDGCGVVTFALPLDRMALAFSRLHELAGGPRVAAAMRAYPDLIRGGRSPDTLLMRTGDGWVAKGGAEGVFCAVRGDGLAVAAKVEDGNPRALPPALGAFLAQLGEPLEELADHPLHNSRGERVGEIVLDASRSRGAC